MRERNNAEGWPRGQKRRLRFTKTLFPISNVFQALQDFHPFAPLSRLLSFSDFCRVDFHRRYKVSIRTFPNVCSENHYPPLLIPTFTKQDKPPFVSRQYYFQMALRTSWPCGNIGMTTLFLIDSGMEKIRCNCLKRRNSAVLESTLPRDPISWKPPRAMKCL